MNYKCLGSTKLKVFPIGFGTGFSDTEYSEPKKIVNILKKAIDSGINLIDTAENYGNGLSEELVGKAIKRNRSKILLATKFSPENSSYQQVIKSCNLSLKRLNTDYIDIYQFHWPNPTIPLEESVNALKKLKKDGKIRYIGAGNFSKKEVIKLRKFLGLNDLVSVQTEFNLHEHYIKTSKLLEYCIKNDLNIIAYSPLDQGRVEEMNSKQKQLIEELSKKHNKTGTQIILNWIVNKHPLIPIPKTTSFKHLVENINSVNFQLSDIEYKKIDTIFKPKIHKVPIADISISKNGERGKGGYQSLKEALENKQNLVPSPKDLSLTIRNDASFKPVRLIPLNKGGKKYFLINGRIRYWAWVLAFKKHRPIPSYIREH